MSARKLCLVLCCVLALPATNSFGQTAAASATPASVASSAPPLQPPWDGASIMPRRLDLQVQIGCGAPPPPPKRNELPKCSQRSIFEFEWPATVSRVEGQWLWIEDQGGYAVPRCAGWVSTRDVLRLDTTGNPPDAQSYYTEQLRQQPGASWLHWLRGICLEAKGQAKAAQREYEKALCLGGMPAARPATEVENMLRRAGGDEGAIAQLIAAWAIDGPFRDLLDRVATGGHSAIGFREALQRAGLQWGVSEAINRAFNEVTLAEMNKAFPAAKLNGTDQAKKVPPAGKLSGTDGQTFKTFDKFADFLVNLSAGDLAPDTRRTINDHLGNALGRLNAAVPTALRLEALERNFTSALLPPEGCDPVLADAFLRLHRLKAREAASSAGAAYAALQICIQIQCGHNRRPRAFFEVAEAFEMAYHDHVRADKLASNGLVVLVNEIELRRDAIKDVFKALEGDFGELKKAEQVPASDESARKAKQAKVKAIRAKIAKRFAQVSVGLAGVHRALERLNETKGYPAATYLPEFGQQIAELGALTRQFERTLPPADAPVGFNAIGDALGKIEGNLAKIAKEAFDKANLTWQDMVADKGLLGPKSITESLLRIDSALHFIITGERLNIGKALAGAGSDTDGVATCQQTLFGCADKFYRLSVCAGVGDSDWYLGYHHGAQLALDRNDFLSRIGTILWSDAQNAVEYAEMLELRPLPMLPTLESAPAKGVQSVSLWALPASQRQPKPKSMERSRLAAAIQDRCDDLVDTAVRLEQVAAGYSIDAIKLLDCAIRLAPDRSDLHRDRGLAYWYRVQVNDQYIFRRRLLDGAIAQYTDADGKLQQANTQKKRVTDAITRIVNDRIDAEEKWPLFLADPIKVMQKLGPSWKRSDDEEKTADDAKDKLADAIAKVAEIQQRLGEIGDLQRFLESERKACELAKYRADGDNVDALTYLARAYHALGDYRNAEYYQNRALYYAQEAFLMPGQVAALQNTREIYRKKIAPWTCNPFWRDSPSNLPDGVSAISTGSGGQ
jgi:hypothetical protein